MKKLILIAVATVLALLILRGILNNKEMVVDASSPPPPAVGVPDEGLSDRPLSLIVGGENPVEGDMGVNEFTLRHREVQINPTCLGSDFVVQKGDAVEFSPFGDTVIQGKVQHVQAAALLSLLTGCRRHTLM